MSWHPNLSTCPKLATHARQITEHPALIDADLRHWQLHTFLKNDDLTLHESVSNQFLLLGSGEIRVQLRNRLGRTLTLYRQGPSQPCMISMREFTKDPHLFINAIAENEGWYACASHDEYQRLMHDSAHFRNWIMQEIGEKFSAIVTNLQRIAFDPLEERVASLLLERIDDQQRITATQQQLAAELGTAREVINRQLARFQTNGWIKRRRGSIDVIDVRALQDLGR